MRPREKRYVTGFGQPDAEGRVRVELEIIQLSGRQDRTWCEICLADLTAAAEARGAVAWTVEDVKTVAGCAGIRM